MVPKLSLVDADAVADTAHAAAANIAIAFVTAAVRAIDCNADVDAAIDFVVLLLLASYSFSNQHAFFDVLMFVRPRFAR